MRRFVTVVMVAWGLTSHEAWAQCTPSVGTPTRSGNRVEVILDYCASAPAGTPPGGGTAPSAAAAAPAASPGAPSGLAAPFNLYGGWEALTKAITPPSPPPSGPAPAAAAAAGAVPAAPGAAPRTAGDAFDSLLGVPDLLDPETDELRGVRIDERDNVTIRLVHFNFINFSAEYAVDTKVIEAYVTLNTLWSQALGLGRLGLSASPGPQPCPADATFARCVTDWMWALTLSSRRLDDAVRRHSQHVGLSAAVIANEVVPEAQVLQKLRAQLIQLQTDTLSRQPESMPDITWYQQVQTAHDKLMAQLGSYLRLAELTAAGQTKPIDKQKAGTLVTVRITAVNALGNMQGRPTEIKYFVHSRLPVRFHAGYLYSNLKEIEFEQVRTVAGADLFQQVQDPSSVQSYGAFLSYEFFSRNTGRYATGILGTLGTDFEEPGKRLYVGASVRFLSRVYLGFGALSGSVAEGQNKVIEQIGEGLGSRELFTTVTSRREWKPYFHISFGVFN